MIPDPPAISLFVVAALALLLVPGPAVLYIVARSIHEGRRAGLVSVLGIHVGTQGIVVNVLNPKTALFFLAFLPQFVDPNASHPAVQIAFLGVLFALLGLVTDSVWALASGTAGGMLRRSRHFVRTQRYVTGTVYIGLGVATAFAGPAEAD